MDQHSGANFLEKAHMADTPIDMSHLARYTGGDRTLNTEILKLFNGQLNDMKAFPVITCSCHCSWKRACP